MTRDRTAAVGIAVAVATLVAAALQFSGGYYALATGILGAVVGDRRCCAAHRGTVALATRSLRRVDAGRPGCLVGCLDDLGRAATRLVAIRRAHARGRLGADRGIRSRGALARGRRRRAHRHHRARRDRPRDRCGRFGARRLVSGAPARRTDRVPQRRGGYLRDGRSARSLGCQLQAPRRARRRFCDRSAPPLRCAPDPIPRLAPGDRDRRPAPADACQARPTSPCSRSFLPQPPPALHLAACGRPSPDRRAPLDDPAFARYVLLAFLLAFAVGALSLISLPPLRLTQRQARASSPAGVTIMRSSRRRSRSQSSCRTSVTSEGRSLPRRTHPSPPPAIRG